MTSKCFLFRDLLVNQEGMVLMVLRFVLIFVYIQYLQNLHTIKYLN